MKKTLNIEVFRSLAAGKSFTQYLKNKSKITEGNYQQEQMFCDLSGVKCFWAPEAVMDEILIVFYGISY